MSEPPQTPPQAARLDEILAHGPWVRRLARRLLNDPSLVDDVCQETWLVALAGGPRHRSGMRAWLGGVVRNLARRERRSERRRRDREARAAALAGDTSTPRDLVAEAEMHGRVTRAVLALPEPYRSTLLMRYFEDLDVAAMAERVGCSASTVRNRHRRALILLRNALDSEHGGDRAAWCRALIPLALAAPGGEGSLIGPAVSVPWKEVLLMTGAKKIAVVTILLAVAGTTWWVLPRGSAAPAPGAAPVIHAPTAMRPSAPATPVPAAEVEPLAAPAPVAAASATPPPEEHRRPGTPVRFSGRVVDPLGRPVAGAEVTYVPDVHTLAAWGHTIFDVLRVLPDLDLPRTRTDAQGRFDLTGLFVEGPAAERTRHPVFNPLQFPELHVSGAGLARRALVLRGYTGGDLAVPDLVAEAGGRVSGRVVDERGAPVPGASVRGLSAMSELAQTSEDVGQKGHASSFLVATTDDDGRWVVEGTPACSAWLSMTAPGYLEPEADSFQTQAGEVMDRGETVLTRGGLIAGRVVGQDGRPLAGARVRASDQDLAHWDRGRDTILYQIGTGGVRTDADGAFEITALTGGTHTVWVDAPGFEPRRVEGVALGCRELLVTVEPQGLLFVDVVDETTGAAIDGATLGATRGAGVDDRPPRLVVEDRGVGAPAGRFRVERPGVFSTQLEVSAPGYAGARGDAPGVAVGGTGEHVVRLVPEAVLAGLVVDAEGSPVPGAEVRLHRVPEAVPGPPPATQEPGVAGSHARKAYEASLVADDRTLESDGEGRFRFGALSEGTYELSAHGTGHAPSGVVTRALERGAHLEDVRVALGEAGVLAGIVRAVDGAPVPGVGVSVVRPDEIRIAASTSTDLKGRFRFDALAPGIWLALVHPSVQQELEIVADATTDVELVVRPRPVLRGRVFDPVTGAGISGASVCMGRHGEVPTVGDGPRQRRWISGNSVGTDADGRFEMVEGRTGSQLLVATLPGGVVTPPVPVDADWGEVLEVDLPTGTAAVEGRVRTVAGEPPGTASLRLLGDVPSHRFVTCEPDGSFLIEHVAPGTYGLQVLAEDAVQLSPLEVVVPAGGVDELLVTVGPAASLDVRVSLPNGAPVEELTHVQLVEPGTYREVAWARSEAGAVRLERIAPGAYELVVGDLGNARRYADDAFVRWREPITLADGEYRELEIVLER